MNVETRARIIPIKACVLEKKPSEKVQDQIAIVPDMIVPYVKSTMERIKAESRSVLLMHTPT